MRTKTINRVKKIEQEIIDLYKSGLSVIDIGDKFFINSKTVYKVLKRHNISREDKLDFIGKNFGKLTVYKRAGRDTSKKTMWECHCGCGGSRIVRTHDLLNGKYKDCGCAAKEQKVLEKELSGYGNITGGYIYRVKYGAQKRNLEYSVSTEYLWDLYLKQNKKCALSGIDITILPTDNGNGQTASLDRIDNSKGYIVGNVHWVHKDINIMKCDHSVQDFHYYCDRVAKTLADKTKDGILYKTSCYLAGPMEFDSDGQNWRDKASRALTDIGVKIFDPYCKPFVDSDRLEEGANEHGLFHKWLETGEYEKVSERMKPIRNFDLNCVDRSDFLIFYINKKIPTFGTIEELTTAVKIKRPIFIFIEGGKQNCPLWLMGMINHRYLYNNLDEILDVLKRINSGEEPININKWRLLKREFR